MMNKLFILGLLLFLSFSVYAIEIQEDYDTNVLVNGLDSRIKLTLSITDAEPGVYSVYSLSDVSINPTESFEINESTFEKEFILEATENLDVLGSYVFTYTLNQKGVEKFDKKFTVNVMELEDVLEISSETIDFSSNEIEFYVKNKENVYLKGLEAEFSSLLFETKKTFDLAPFEKKVIKVVVDNYLLRKTKAGVYVIESVFKTNDGKKTIDGTLYLGEKKGITTTEDKSGLIVITETISKINAGNVFESVEINVERNIISRLFTEFNIEPTRIERSGFVVKYTWVKERLGPAEVVTVKAKTNYLLPFLIIIFAVVALFAIKRFSQSKLFVEKSVKPIKTKGGEFALKVTLRLKAVKSLENLTLVDKIPQMLKLFKNFGSIQPDKIDPQTRRIHWNIGDLKAGEERILTYITYSKIGVVGKFSLPKALAVFEHEDSVSEVESNAVFFMNEQVSTDS